ncbi:MAG: AraC family transcriptional regulator, partial [Stenotrophomonas maltophilia]
MSRYFTFADYRRFGHRHGFDYRAAPEHLRDDQWAGHGEVNEQFLRGGMSLIASDVHNRFPYVATAQQSPGLAIRVMLQGQVDVRIPRRGGFTLRAGTAMTAHHREQVEMTGTHPGETRMRGVSVMVPGQIDPDLFQLPQLETAL